MALPAEVLFGLYLGLLTGIVPAFVSGALGFMFKYLTGVTLPGLGVVVLAVAIAGINGGLMGLLDPAVASSPRVLVAIVVVMMLSLYAHSQGDKLGATLPRRFSLRRLRARTLSADALDRFGSVTVTVSGAVTDLEGYPAVPADLRAEIETGSWSFPGDLPLSEVERRFADRLQSEFDLADVSVSVDSSGRATVAAAPPAGRLSRKTPAGKRAVSITALLPTGVSRGDRVIASTPQGTVAGEVVSARTTGDDPPEPRAFDEGLDDGDDDVATDGGKVSDGGSTSGGDKLADGGTTASPPESVASPSAPTTDGGEGRVTLVVSRADANVLLAADRARVWVASRGTHREYELVSLLQRAGKRFRRVTVGRDSDLVGVTVGDGSVRVAHDVGVMAVKPAASDDESGSRRDRGRVAGYRDRDPTTGSRRDREVSESGWAFAPRGDHTLAAGDELFVVGTRAALSAFVEVAS